jgi:23S rRNA (uracil1939-C5)-methyltransferase
MPILKVLAPSYSPHFEAVDEKSQKVLIPQTAPGEVWQGEHLKGGIYRPIKPLKFNSDIRRTPPCGYYPLCSGCQWLHLKPQAQTEFKKKLFEEHLGFSPDRVLTSPSELHYRVSTFLYHRDGKLGFKTAWFYDESQPLLEIENCPLLHPRLNEGIKILKGFEFPESLHAVALLVNPQNGELFLKLHFLRQRLPEGRLIENLIKELKPAFAGIGIYEGEYLHWERRDLYGKWESPVKVGKYTLFISPDAFVQPNYPLWEEFLNLVEPLGFYENGIELHAGIGFFTLKLSEFVKKLESSELNPFATSLREKATRTNRVGNVKNLSLDVFKHLKRTQKVDLLLVDPPRGGLTKPLIGEILKKQPGGIIYVSCNLLSLKRDLELLREKYEVVKSALVDQFPNTFHVESVVWLKKV